MKSDKKAVSEAIDSHVNRRLKTLRILTNVSQLAIARALGVSTAQVYKYERGESKMTASKMWLAAKRMNIPIVAFYDEMPTHEDAPPEKIKDMTHISQDAYRTAQLLMNCNANERAALRRLIRVIMSKKKRKADKDPALKGA